MSKTRVLVLAGGKGTRMGADVPKALVPIHGTPFIDYILNRVEESGVDPKPAVVVGHDLDQLVAHMGDRAEVVIQEEQLGTGHAVQVAEGQLKNADVVLVTYGDHPLYKPETYAAMVKRHAESDATITMLTTELPDYNDWRALFTHWGRVVRDASGKVTAVREYKICSEEQKQIKEVNNGMYCFDGAWLWENVGKIDNDNPKQEYYLTTIFDMAMEQGKKVVTVQSDPEEGIGINTPEELVIAEKIVAKQ